MDVTLRAMHPEDLPGERYPVKSDRELKEEEIVERIAALIDVAISVDTASNISHCAMCDCLDDDHTVDCPVRWLEEWMSRRAIWGVLFWMSTGIEKLLV